HHAVELAEIDGQDGAVHRMPPGGRTGLSLRVAGPRHPHELLPLARRTPAVLSAPAVVCGVAPPSPGLAVRDHRHLVITRSGTRRRAPGHQLEAHPRGLRPELSLQLGP